MTFAEYILKEQREQAEISERLAERDNRLYFKLDAVQERMAFEYMESALKGADGYSSTDCALAKLVERLQLVANDVLSDEDNIAALGYYAISRIVGYHWHNLGVMYEDYEESHLQK